VEREFTFERAADSSEGAALRTAQPSRFTAAGSAVGLRCVPPAADFPRPGRRARALVEREFTFEKAVERWRRILEETMW